MPEKLLRSPCKAIKYICIQTYAGVYNIVVSVNRNGLRGIKFKTEKGRAMEQLELELGNFKVLQAIKKSQEKRNEEARKNFFRFFKFNFRKNARHKK